MMYILFEKRHSNGDRDITEFDCMGYTKSEDEAVKYVNNNPEYRTYKPCPDREFPITK